MDANQFSQLSQLSQFDIVDLVVLTGLSGAGKSVALGVLEDAGYYCVDNLPARLLPELIDDMRHAGQSQVAVSIDARTMHHDADTRDELPSILQALKGRGVSLRTLYLEATTETIVRRYSETRRRHPLSDDTRTISECVDVERELLQHMAEQAHHIDTSDVRPSTLRQWVKDFLQQGKSGSAEVQGLTLIFTSFGFKAGIPLDADMVFDVRPLPNPHYEPDLKVLTGRDAPVIAFLAGVPEVGRMLDDIENFIARWLPSYVRDNRSYLTVAIGCTGGQHRSVYFVEALARHFARHSGTVAVLLRHRELRAL